LSGWANTVEGSSTIRVAPVGFSGGRTVIFTVVGDGDADGVIEVGDGAEVVVHATRTTLNKMPLAMPNPLRTLITKR
jgi:hypothetical protein